MKDLEYKDLRIPLSEKDFNNRLKKIKKAVIRYKDENIQKTEDDFRDGDFLEVFKDTEIDKNLISVFVLTMNIIDIIRKDKNDQDLFKNIFSFGSPDYGTMQKLLLDTESFLKRLAGLIYGPSIIETIDNNKWTFADFINIEYNGDSFINTRFKVFAYVLKEYKNKNASHDVIINGKYIFTDDEAAREIVLRSIACFVLLIVNDKFDIIDAVLQNPDIITNKDVSGELDTYISQLKNKQLELLNRIYDIKEINEIGLSSITNISLKSFNQGGKKMEDDSHVLLAGESGTGKSTLLASMIYKDIQKWEENHELSFPIKIEMKDFDSENKDSFIGFIVGQIKKELDIKNGKERSDLIHDYLRQLFKEGRVTLYVDGLNELKPSLGEIRNDAIRGLIKVSKDYDRCRYVVTSRIKDMGLDEEEGESIYGDLIENGTFGSFHRYDLQPFDESQIEEQIGKYLNAISGGQVNQRRVKGIADRIAKNKIKDLAKNPLQLIHIIRFFNENNNRGTLSVSNRSQLLINLTRHIVKVKFNNPGDDTPKKINHEIKKILFAIANEQYYRKNNQGLGIEEINLLCDNIISKTIDPRWTVERMLDTAITFGILEKKDELYDFRHDSWREHFQAYNIVRGLIEKLKKRETPEAPQGILDIVSKDTNQFTDNMVTDFFRHIFEILEAELLVAERENLTRSLGTCQKREKIIEDEIRKAEEDEEYQKYKEGEYDYSRLSKLQDREKHIKALKEELAQQEKDIAKNKEDYLVCTALRRQYMSQFANALLLYNNGLRLLAYATATMESFDLENTDMENPQPKVIVEREIMQRASSYKDSHPFGITSEIKLKLKQHIDNKLKPLFEYIAVSGNERLYAEIFDLYWLNIWLNIWPNYKEETEHHRILFVLPGVMISKSENQLALFNQMFVAYQRLCLLKKIELAQRVERMMMRLIARMDDGDVIDIIANMLSHEGEEYAAPFDYPMKRRIGAKALLGLKDADLMFKILNDRPELESYKFNTTIHIQTVDNLLEKFADPRMQEFLVGNHYAEKPREGLIETLPQGEMEHLKMLRFLLSHFRKLDNLFKKTLLDYLVSNQGQEVVSAHPELMDILKLEDVPETLKNRYELTTYDKDPMSDLYKTENINYTVFYKTEGDGRIKYTIAIPCPEGDNLNSFDIEIFVRAENSIVKIKSDDYTLTKQESGKHTMLLIEWINGIQQDIPFEGKLRFLKDEEVIPQCFEKFRDLICLNHPKSYHASVCDKLIEECNDYDDYRDMFFFFKEKSRIGLLLDRFYRKCMKGDSSHNWDIGRIELCEILGVGLTQVSLFSPLRSRVCEMCSDGTFKETTYKRGVINIDYGELPIETGFVILEKNEMISPINMNILNPDNMHLFGCINGSFKHNQDGNVIQTKVLKQGKDSELVVFHLDKTDDLYLVDDDMVFFFPSIKTDNDKVTFIAKQVKKQSETI